ncbi:PAS domain S-box protein [Halanaerobacter jeridensis]|uniref:Stage 0 sporulation protein A homolog n=1 Tax=Halanaerobacter jeridensis TaxID=706427 RepID=A0A939BMQ0_9FIRM|nr:PAS domain S-box protein [Halanaerobacter jeridensis]MBM7557090.1 PAS domain S-box-containing protein [Halanaerobacter jeridensis]
MANILVVGADSHLLREIRDSLNDSEYNLTAVSNSQTAIDEIEKNNYNLILLNYNHNNSDLVNEINLDLTIILMIKANEKSEVLELLKSRSICYVVKDNCFPQFLSVVVNRNIDLQETQSTYYESLFKDSGQILLLINPTTGKIADANTTAVNFYGWSKEELLNKTIQEINTLTKAEVFAEMKAAKEEDRNYFQFEHRLAGDQLKDVEVYSGPIMINGQKLLYSMIYDITERKQLKEELEGQEEKYKVLFETTGTATIIVEEDTTISLANQQMVELSGYSKRQLEGKKSWTDFVAYQEELEKLKSYHQARRSEGEEKPPNTYEFHFKDRFGTVKNVLINIRILPNQKQSIASMNDITELKVKEEKLNQNIEQARKLHKSFLPQAVIDLEEIVISSYYSPAEKLGGDFYNFQQIENKLIFYLADVSGHGLDGAILNISIKEKINNVIRKESAAVTGEDILRRVYQEYQKDDFPEDYFVCLQLGILDLDTMRLQYNNVGAHIPPLLISRRGKVNEILKPNLPISTVVNKDLIDFNDQVNSVQDGDKLLLITDGLFEESRAGEMFGEKRLVELLKEYYPLSAEMLVQVIREEFRKFIGQKDKYNTSNDDITLVVLEHKGKNRLEKEFASQLCLLEEIVAEIINFLKDHTQQIMDIQMGLHEMLANAVEHGNQLNEEKKVKIKVAVTDDYLRIIIQDEGTGFDHEEKLNNSLEDSGCQERGRGIIITKQLFDQLQYNKKGNQVCLVKFRGDKNG